MLNNDIEKNLNHDINATLSSLLTALELINDEWKSSPELVDRIIPLTVDKIELLSLQVKEYRKIRTAYLSNQDQKFPSMIS